MSSLSRITSVQRASINHPNLQFTAHCACSSFSQAQGPSWSLLSMILHAVPSVSVSDRDGLGFGVEKNEEQEKK